MLLGISKAIDFILLITIIESKKRKKKKHSSWVDVVTIQVSPKVTASYQQQLWIGPQIEQQL